MLDTRMFPYMIDSDLELHAFDYQYVLPLYRIVERDRAYLRRYQNWPDQVRSLRDMYELVDRSLRKTHHSQGFDAVIWYQGRAVGKIGLVYLNWLERFAEIGYWLAQDTQGQGVMTRCCRVIVNYALLYLDLNIVQIRCAEGNTRSSAIARRLGFYHEGLSKHRIWIHGRPHREDSYIMTQAEWRQQMIYHITTRAEWQAAQEAGEYRAPSLETQGFIHFSNLDQITKVANAIYQGLNDLVILCVDPAQLNVEVKYEPPDTSVPAEHEDTERFPHVYSAVNVQAVVKCVDFPANVSGSFTLPYELAKAE